MRYIDKELDLSGYSATRGIARNGSVFATFRKSGQPTLTAFGEAADALLEATMHSGKVTLEAEGTSKAMRIAAVDCPVTGLQITEHGRLEPARVEATPAVIPEQKSWWQRFVSDAKQFMGIQPASIEPLPRPAIPGRTGYPVVDHLVDRIAEKVKENPNLMDENGARFDALASRHLPRLALVHTEAVRGASAQEVKEADAMLANALRSMELSLESAEKRDRRGRLDSLTVEVNFLKARHGLDNGPPELVIPSADQLRPELLEKAAVRPSGRLLEAASQLDAPNGVPLSSLMKGPQGQEPDEAVVVHLHQAGRSGASR